MPLPDRQCGPIVAHSTAHFLELLSENFTWDEIRAGETVVNFCTQDIISIQNEFFCRLQFENVSLIMLAITDI